MLEAAPGYVTDVIADDAISFIEESTARGEPFYAGVHFTAPHSPWLDGEHPRELVDLYRDSPFSSCPQEPHHPEAVLRMSPEDARACLGGYFAAVTGMDRAIGRIIRRLDELDVRENTLVCFLSDNGFNCGHHGIWGKGNGTLTLNVYDTSVKVPALFSMPGTVSAGVVRSELVSGYDFMPTLLTFLGLPVPAGLHLPGRSVAGLLRDPAPERHESGRDDVVVFDEYGPVRMIRTREWKYVHRYPYGEHELYDLENDPGETTNRYGDPGAIGVARELKARLDEWFYTYADPAMDGIREPVCGNGQIDRAGLYARGRLAFMQGRQVTTDPRYDPGMKKHE
jgi:arylsulfatase A-like enzyme